MDHTEAIHEIIKVLTETNQEFNEMYKTKTSFMVINVFTKQIKQIKQIIIKKDSEVLSACLQKMNDLYLKGDQTLRNAVETVFVFSLDSLTFCCDKNYRQIIFNQLPSELHNAYVHQVYTSGK